MVRSKIYYFIVICLFAAGHLTFALAQNNAKVIVPCDVNTDTLLLNPQSGLPPAQEGRIYFDTNTRLFYYNIDGTAGGWRAMGSSSDSRGGAAAIVVAAYNSAGSVNASGQACLGDGSYCNNPKADYTCRGASFTADLDGDGSNETIWDDRWLIRWALDRLGNGTGGGVVYLLEGDFKMGIYLTFSKNVNGSTINDSNKSLIGSGPGTVLIFDANAIQQGFLVYDSSRITISQLTMDAQNNGNGIGIRLSNTHYSMISKIKVINTGGSMQSYSLCGVSLSSSSYNTISEVKVDPVSPSHWCSVLLNSPHNFITDNVFFSRDFQYQDPDDGEFLWGGVLLYKSDYNVIARNQIERCGRYSPAAGILLKTCAHNVIYQNRMLNNPYQATSSTHAIYLKNSSYCRISNNHIVDAGGNEGNGITLENGASVSSGNSITNNMIAGFGSQGLRLDASGANSVCGNILFNNGVGSNDGARITAGGYLAAGNFLFYPASGSTLEISNSSNYLAANYLNTGSVPYDTSYNLSLTADNNYFTGPTKIILEPVAYTINPGYILLSSPGSYLRINLDSSCQSPCTSLNINDILPGPMLGSVSHAGDILIIECVSTQGKYVNFTSTGNVKKNRTLLHKDILTLIWDGANDVWVELAYARNRIL